MNTRPLLLAALTTTLLTSTLHAQTAPAPLAWPTPTAENRLWTRWWWLGNAVDAPNLTKQLQQFHDAGLGGVEICPIYGTYGAENRYIDFLSPKWIDMLAHTSRETQRLGMRVDMTTGTGWPFGGNMVPDDNASQGIVLKSFAKLPDKKDFPAGKLIAATVYPPGRQPVSIDPRPFETGAWFDTPPDGRWVLAFQTGPQQKVKRPAPGAEGNVLDPYSLDSLNKYLAHFDAALKLSPDAKPRAQFHDSFEYYQASWTPNFFDEFQKRRGYDLRPHLAELNNEGDKDTIARVKCDYRETLSDLHLAYMNRWVAWSHEHGGLGRNQAHGGPGNILDVYANADIPECEVFHLYDESQLPFLKLASSAAHLTGKPLTSSETFTWLDEHFNSSLAQVKTEADFIFLAGVNHMFLHGIPYSPEDAAWPGWQFYASVNFGPQGGLWRDFPAFTAYVARVQSILQANKPGNDVLLYVPWHEFWSDPANNDKQMLQFTTPGTWMKPYAYYDAAMAMYKNGCQFDEVSDSILQKVKVNPDHTIDLGGNSYKTIVIPKTPVIPVETFKKLVELANDGTTIVFQDDIPTDVPGWIDSATRRAQLKSLTPELGPSFVVSGIGVVSTSRVGNGRFDIRDRDHLSSSLEPMYQLGLRCVRRQRPDGFDYFVVNRSSQTAVNVPLAGIAKSALILDPRFDNRIGIAKTSTRGLNETNVLLRIAPGESYIIRTYTDRVIEGPAWQNPTPAGNPIPLAGTWSVAFIDGGPVLPKPFTTAKLDSWTTLGDADAQRFAGTAKYSLTFDKPAGAATDYQLDLGQVGDSARITLNGTSLGTLWAPPYTITLGGAIKAGQNKLEIEVTNVAANRIRDMDQRGVQWKIFRDANVLSTAYTKFDASAWPLRPAGLLGPVQLIPLRP